MCSWPIKKLFTLSPNADCVPNPNCYKKNNHSVPKTGRWVSKLFSGGWHQVKESQHEQMVQLAGIRCAGVGRARVKHRRYWLLSLSIDGSIFGATTVAVGAQVACGTVKVFAMSATTETALGWRWIQSMRSRKSTGSNNRSRSTAGTPPPRVVFDSSWNEK